MDDINVFILVNDVEIFGIWIMFIVDVYFLLSVVLIECYRILFIFYFKRVFCNLGVYRINFFFK